MSLAKKRIRRLVLDELDGLDQNLFQEKCIKIRERLFHEAIWEEAETVALTLSTGREVETPAIITRAWAEMKTVVVPKCDPKQRTMTFYKIRSFAELTFGFYGLMEPDPVQTESVSPDEIDLAIVPGVVFDRAGNRIGYGGGYYDRFLRDFQGRTISLLLSAQLRSCLPVERHDQRIDMLITEDECILPNEKRIDESN